MVGDNSPYLHIESCGFDSCSRIGIRNIGWFGNAGFLLTVIYDKTKKYYSNNKTENKNIIENVEYEIHKDEEE